MKKHPFTCSLRAAPLVCFALIIGAPSSSAKYIGCDPPQICRECGQPGNFVAGEGATSLTEGNLQDGYAGPNLRSGFGSTLALGLVYNSYNADGSRAQVDTVLGYGWTHSFNIFLFFQRGHAFRFDGSGRVTKYQLGPGGTFKPDTGYFETLVRNPDNSFTLTQKDKTVYRFEQVAGTPFLVGGPVWRLVRITDRNNNVTTLTYTAGRLTSITDTYGRTLTLIYNAQDKLVRVTDPLGRMTRFTYDAKAGGRRLSQIIDPLGKKVIYTYNTLHQITSKKDKDGRLFTYSYQGTNPISMRDGSGAPWFTLSNPNNWATNLSALANTLCRMYLPSTAHQNDGRGNAWRYEYDTHGYVTREIAPDGATTRYTYDPGTLRVASMTDANNHLTRYEYDARGNRTKVIDPLNNVTTYTYEPMFNQMATMTDPNGRLTTYEYDASGNRTRETQAMGLPEERTRIWTYDSHGNMLTYTDWRGTQAEYTYDANGNRASMTEAMGTPEERTTTYMYDAVGNLREQTDALLRTTRYQYDGLDRVIVVTDPLNQQTRYMYDGRGNQIEIIDRNNHITRFAYDLRNRLITNTDALGQPEKYTYDANNNRITTTDRNNHTTQFDYDLRNRVEKITDAEGNITRFEYDPVGNLLRQIDPRGNPTEYTYDPLNRRVTMLAPDGGLTTYEYASLAAPCCSPTLGSGLVTKQTDGNGKVTCYKYDNLDRRIREVRKQTDTDCEIEDGDDAIARHSYDASDNRLSLTEPNGNITTYEYDPLNRVVRWVNAAGDTTRYGYDAVDNRTQVISPNGNVTTSIYNALDRPTAISDLEGSVRTYTYDPEANRLTDSDGLGHTTRHEYDAIDRVIETIDPLSQVTTMNYDPVNNLVESIDREGNRTTHVYDDINRRTRMCEAAGTPIARCTEYEYDPVGNLARVTDANGHVTEYEYDPVNRRTSEIYPDPSPNTRTFTYDFAGNLTTRTDQKGQATTYSYNDLYHLLQRDYPVTADDNMTYDLSGRLLSAERGGWLVTMTYDGANRLTSSVQNGEATTYIYDVPNRTRQITYPGGRELLERSDFRSRLLTVDDAGSPPPIVTYSYDAADRVVTRTHRNGTIATYAYNDNNWVTSLEHASGVTRVAGFGYDFDPEGHKRFEEKRPDAGNSQTRSEAYQYDQLHRLIDYKVGTLVGSTVPVPATQTQYTLDPVDNWDAKTKDAVTEPRMHSASNEITQIGAVPVLSDLNGNTNEDGQYRYNYDEENRLVRVSRKSDQRVVGRYEYDALGRRVRKAADPAAISSPVETRYFYDHNRIVEEQTAAGVTQASYVYGNYVDEILTMDRGGAFYHHQNGLWSVEALTDAAGATVERYGYDAYGLPAVFDGSGALLAPNAWGTPHSAIGNPWLFTGRQFEEENALYFYRARHHDPVKGRFLQRDPLGYIDGMNLYAYVENSPTMHVDPFGLLTWNNLPTVFTEVNENDRFVGSSGVVSLRQVQAWAVTVPRLNVGGLCSCPSRWPWLDNVEVTYMTVDFFSQVYLQPRYELRGATSEQIREVLIEFENQHVQDFLDWANTRGKKLAEQAERELKRNRYYFLSDCAKDAGSWMYITLGPSLESAGAASIRRWDAPINYHDVRRRFARP